MDSTSTASKIEKKHTASIPKYSPFSNSVINDSLLIVSVYLSFAVTVYLCNPDGYSGVKTLSAVDAFYFAVNTMCTVGYRDITPLTAVTKTLTCVLVIIGFGIFRSVLPRVVFCLLDDRERSIVATTGRNTPTSLKVFFAVGVVVLSIGVGMFGLYFLEELDFVDSFHLSVVSVTTVGYGRAFKTLHGRVFASVWLLISTSAVASAFLFLAKARIDKRHQRIARDSAVDINHDDFLSFMISKLKEMGRISEKRILEINEEFDQLDPNNTGKITCLI